MTGFEDPYEKAVDQFSKIVAAASGPDAGSIRSLARASGLPTTSAQDTVTRLERLGFLTRMMAGRVERGRAALEVGLSALGFGHYARVIDPVLEQVRFQGGGTAFIGIWTNDRMQLVAITGPQAARLRGRPIEMADPGKGVRLRIDDLTLQYVEIAQVNGARLLIGTTEPNRGDQDGRTQQALAAALKAFIPDGSSPER